VAIRLVLLFARVTVVAIAALGAVYVTYLQPQQLRWGATDAEVAGRLPGDWIVGQAGVSATRVVTIDAPPDQVWPWIVQMGTGRAGFYAFDWLDNGGAPSADRVLAQFQSPQAGDVIPVPAGRRTGYVVKGFQLNHYMLWVSRSEHVTWCWLLSPLGDRRTRLVTRIRFTRVWTSPTVVGTLWREVGDAFRIRRCLLGIKARAEALARSGRAPAQRDAAPAAPGRRPPS
jgi:hypothetical protein